MSCTYAHTLPTLALALTVTMAGGRREGARAHWRVIVPRLRWRPRHLSLLSPRTPRRPHSSATARVRPRAHSPPPSLNAAHKHIRTVGRRVWRTTLSSNTMDVDVPSGLCGVIICERNDEASFQSLYVNSSWLQDGTWYSNASRSSLSSGPIVSDCRSALRV